MPNWCITDITISHSDSDKLSKLYNLIEEWTSKNYMENGFGHSWLGNVVLGSKVGTVDAKEKTDLRCRGSITYLELVGNELLMSTETAWDPMLEMWVKVLEMWVKVLEKYLPDAKLTYTAEECGMGLYWTNDDDLVGKWYIDCFGDVTLSNGKQVESAYDSEQSYVVSVLQDLTGLDTENVYTLLKNFKETEYDDVIGFHKWEFVAV